MLNWKGVIYTFFVCPESDERGINEKRTNKDRNNRTRTSV